MSTFYYSIDYQPFKPLTMSTVNKKKLLRKAAFESGLSVKDVEKAVDAFLCAVSDILREDGEVIIPDFGKFYIYRFGERVCRNPQTGEKFIAPPMKKVKFKAFGNVINYTLKYGR
mgnify:FL=1